MGRKHICTKFNITQIPGGIRKECRVCKKAVRIYSQGVFGKDIAKGLPTAKKRKK